MKYRHTSKARTFTEVFSVRLRSCYYQLTLRARLLEAIGTTEEKQAHADYAMFIHRLVLAIRQNIINNISTLPDEFY